MEAFLTLLPGLLFVFFLYEKGCYHIDTKEEVLKKVQQRNTEGVLYCKNYCKELSSKSFSYSPTTGCSCNFGIETKK